MGHSRDEDGHKSTVYACGIPKLKCDVKVKILPNKEADEIRRLVMARPNPPLRDLRTVVQLTPSSDNLLFAR